jgi:hypothetical protein
MSDRCNRLRPLIDQRANQEEASYWQTGIKMSMVTPYIDPDNGVVGVLRNVDITKFWRGWLPEKVLVHSFALNAPNLHGNDRRFS